MSSGFGGMYRTLRRDLLLGFLLAVVMCLPIFTV